MTGHFAFPFLWSSLFLIRKAIYFCWHCLKWKLFVWVFNSHRFLACIQPCRKEDFVEDKLTTTGRILAITLSDLPKDYLFPEQLWCKLKKTFCYLVILFQSFGILISQPSANNGASYRICLHTYSRAIMAECAAIWYHTVSQSFASQHAIPFCSTVRKTRKKH